MNRQDIYRAIERNPATAYQEQTGEDITYELGQIPVNLHQGLVNYMLLGLAPGSFLTAALCNDFMLTATKADTTCRNFLPELARVFYNAMPARSHGSREIFEAWCESGGVVGRREAA